MLKLIKLGRRPNATYMCVGQRSNLKCLSSDSLRCQPNQPRTKLNANGLLEARRSDRRPVLGDTERAFCAMKEVEDFMKKTKIQFLSSNQVVPEEKLTRQELILTVVSVVFAIIVGTSYFVIYRARPTPVDVDYEKYAYKPNQPEPPKILDTTEKKRNILIREF